MNKEDYELARQAIDQRDAEAAKIKELESQVIMLRTEIESKNALLEIRQRCIDELSIKLRTSAPNVQIKAGGALPDQEA